MEQFLAVAVAHFLALLIPGVDFFLIVRLAATNGWKVASGACLGVSLANATFIALAFSGVALVTNPVVLGVLQAAGGCFLMFVGISFFRSGRPQRSLTSSFEKRSRWLESLGLGFASGILNPKNALFYVSLASALASAPPSSLVLYGVWMFSVVLIWDLFVAIMLGSERALAHMRKVIPWLSRAAGVFLFLFGAGMIASLCVQLLALR